MSQFFASGGQSFGASATCSGIKSLNLSRCWFSHLYYGKQASSIRCISTTVSDSRHYGEHLSGPSKIGLQGKNNLQYFPRVLPSLAAMEIEFALDWEKSLIPQRIEGQSCRGLETQGGLQLLYLQPLPAPCLVLVHWAQWRRARVPVCPAPPQLSSQARLRPPTPRGAAEGKTPYGWMTVSLDGAQGLDSADANKNSSSCDLCPQPRFSHPESQCPGEAGKLSPDEATEAQREQGSPDHPVS